MDWHGDKKASASSFYPKHGRKGKKMTGKPGRDELLRATDAKWLKKWKDAFKLIHKRFPSDGEQHEVLRTCSVRAEYERLMNGCVSVVIDVDTSDMLAHGDDPVSYLKSSIAQMKSDEKDKQTFEMPTEEELAKARNLLRIRSECPVPFDLMKKVRDGKADRAIVAEVFDLSMEKFNIYFETLFNGE